MTSLPREPAVVLVIVLVRSMIRNAASAMAIIDKVANQKNRIQLDSLYAAISLSYEYEGEKGADDMSKADIVSTKIEDDGIRKMANAMKSIMTETEKDSSPLIRTLRGKYIYQTALRLAKVFLVL